MPSHFNVSVQNLMTFAWPLVKPPIASTNDRFAEVISLNFFASLALNASQPDVCNFTRASVLASGVGFAGAAVLAAVLELDAALSSFLGSSFLGSSFLASVLAAG